MSKYSGRSQTSLLTELPAKLMSLLICLELLLMKVDLIFLRIYSADEKTRFWCGWPLHISFSGNRASNTNDSVPQIECSSLQISSFRPNICQKCQPTSCFIWRADKIERTFFYLQNRVHEEIIFRLTSMIEENYDKTVQLLDSTRLKISDEQNQRPVTMSWTQWVETLQTFPGD